jgi:cysteinyl-tRNA synthetase
MLQLAGEKMSKSIGNLVTIEDLLARHSGEAFRLLVLNSSYRNPLTFSDEVVEQAERALERLRGGLRPAAPAPVPPAEAEAALAGQTRVARSGFEEAMDDDFNTAGALGHLFELVRAIHQARDAGVGAQALSQAQAVLKELAGVLGLRLEVDRSGERAVEPLIDLLIQVREALRREKQWSLADRIRQGLEEQGIVLEDGKGGTGWRQR